MALTASSRIAQIYLPQFEQFGLTLEADGRPARAAAVNEVGAGSAWVIPVSENCLIMEHEVTPAKDMLLLEQAAEPYACVSHMNAQTLSCMPDNGIVPGFVARPRGDATGGPGAETLCTFVQSSLHDEYSPLKAGMTYRSRSVIFLSSFFDELERQWPSEFAGLFGAFDSAWSEAALATMASALRSLTYQRSMRPGAQLYAKSVVDAMVAELACEHVAGAAADAARGSCESAQLVAAAKVLVDKALDRGEFIGIDEVTARLYVSRSKLCAVFKRECGESLGAYARRRRTERACELLADGRLSVVQVAARLGYARQAAFSQAFKQATGATPTAWQEAHGSR